MKLKINDTTFLVKFAYTPPKVIKKGGKFPRRVSTCYIKTPLDDDKRPPTTPHDEKDTKIIIESSVANHSNDPFVRSLGRAYSFWAAVNNLCESGQYGLTKDHVKTFAEVFDQQCPSSQGILEDFFKV